MFLRALSERQWGIVTEYMYIFFSCHSTTFYFEVKVQVFTSTAFVMQV